MAAEDRVGCDQDHFGKSQSWAAGVQIWPTGRAGDGSRRGSASIGTLSIARTGGLICAARKGRDCSADDLGVDEKAGKKGSQ